MEILLLSGSVLLLFVAVLSYFQRPAPDSLLEIQKAPVISEAYRISHLIRSGGFACLRSQHVFLLLALPLIGFLLKKFSNDYIGIGFISGFFLCLALLYFSFATATRGNLATAFACMKTNGLQQGFTAARKTGNTIAFFMTGALLLVLFISNWKVHSSDLILGCTFGISLVTIFTRLAGGIFTKSADIGGDLVGKIHADLPEDSPQNPAVIADNIGDNIGDCIGTAADVLETFSVFLLALVPSLRVERMHILLGFFATAAASMFSILGAKSTLAGTQTGVLDSVVAVFRNALLSAPVILLLLVFTFNLLNPTAQLILNMAALRYLGCFLLGILTVVNALFFTWYYTGNALPVRKIIDATKKSAAMNIITSYFFGLESAFAVILSSSIIVLGAYLLMGVKGIFVCAASALGFIPCIMSMDAYGPVVDNAGGICVMSGAPESARQNTDVLDSLGNTMKALTKGYSGSMTLMSGSLLLSTVMGMQTLNLGPTFLLSILCGLGSIFMFGSLIMRGVFYGADYMVKVTLMKMKNESPDNPTYYTQPIKFLSRKSVQYSVLPIISCIGPVLFFWVLKVRLLSSSIIGFLIGIISGILLALKMTISGGALDNAKKTIESEMGEQLSHAEEDLELSLKQLESGTKKSKPVYELLEEVTSGLAVIKEKVEVDNEEITFLISKLKNQIGVMKMERKLSESDPSDLQQGISLILGKANNAQNPIFIKLKTLMDLKLIKNNAVIGDTVGDPLKDAAGVSITNMIKFSIILAILLFEWI